jgi:hypothetical protein
MNHPHIQLLKDAGHINVALYLAEAKPKPTLNELNRAFEFVRDLPRGSTLREILRHRIATYRP